MYNTARSVHGCHAKSLLHCHDRIDDRKTFAYSAALFRLGPSARRASVSWAMAVGLPHRRNQTTVLARPVLSNPPASSVSFWLDGPAATNPYCCVFLAPTRAKKAVPFAPPPELTLG